MPELENLSLFPLNAVLFPYSKLPLFIFEERYKKLINDNINEGKPFGIIFTDNKKIYQTGCVAKVFKVVSKRDNGELNIEISGIQRFQLDSYETGAEGFYVGKVKLYEESDIEYDKEKAEKCVAFYNELIEIVYKGSIRKIYLSDLKWQNNRRSLSFAIAEKCGLNLLERQSLLEIETEDERLDYLLKYFDEVFPKLKEADRISNIIKSDGYIQQD